MPTGAANVCTNRRNIQFVHNNFARLQLHIGTDPMRIAADRRILTVAVIDDAARAVAGTWDVDTGKWRRWCPSPGDEAEPDRSAARSIQPRTPEPPSALEHAQATAKTGSSLSSPAAVPTSTNPLRRSHCSMMAASSPRPYSAMFRGWISTDPGRLALKLHLEDCLSDIDIAAAMERFFSARAWKTSSAFTRSKRLKGHPRRIRDPRA